MPDYTYRPMTAADVPAAHALSAALKWPHRTQDWAMLQRVADGFVALDDGRVIGSAFACHQGAWSTIGLVIVSDDYQSHGIGRRLMDLALASIGPRTALLNATVAGAPLYRKMGFVEFGHIQQRQGTVGVLTAPATPGRWLTAADHPRMSALASAATGLARGSVMQAVFADIEQAVGIDVDGQLQAFAVLRPFGRGRCIGPVVAGSAEQAQMLIEHLLAQVPDAFVRIDIPVGCGLEGFLDSVGLPGVDTVTCMSRGEIPRPSGDARAFALVTQAIG
ncbi:GNAT family N-acetyltransferase [Pseudomonas sp. RIT-To-2]|uniref:GNAT family N-acetyltransferase n=1 Tax=Pseudomonas sp. RIT-To-2 TaxID=3462541 RepID=UPI0024130083